MAKTLWKVLAWIFVICGILAYSMGWIALMTNSVIWSIPPDVSLMLYTTGIIGLFFLIYYFFIARNKKN